MLTDVMTAFDTVDAELAIKVRNSDVTVDKLHTKIHRNVVKAAQENPEQTVANVHLLFIAKNFERIGTRWYSGTGLLPCKRQICRRIQT